MKGVREGYDKTPTHPHKYSYIFIWLALCRSSLPSRAGGGIALLDFEFDLSKVRLRLEADGSSVHHRRPRREGKPGWRMDGANQSFSGASNAALRMTHKGSGAKRKQGAVDGRRGTGSLLR